MANLRLALCMLLKTPVVTSVAIGSLALALVAELDPNLPVTDLKPLAQQVEEIGSSRRDGSSWCGRRGP